MRNNIKVLLASELSSASTYLNRLFYALYDLSSLIHNQKAKEATECLYFEIISLFEANVFTEKLIDITPVILNPRGIKDRVQATQKLLDSMLLLHLNEESMVDLLADYINITYEFAYKLHLILAKETNLEVQFPRINITEMFFPEATTGRNDAKKFKIIEGEKGKLHKITPTDGNTQAIQDPNVTAPSSSAGKQKTTEAVPKFFLNKKSLMNCCDSGASIIDSIELQRNRKYEELMQKGHEAVYNKKHNEALEHFLNAAKHKENSEVLTLIGWVYSILGNSEQAKNSCLRAIQVNPEYGPAYNDLGSYLLAEGEINESFKWFDLAKKAPIYHNREYPYINAGRAYMIKKDYKMALVEFNTALTLAPFHQELQQTIDRLKNSLKKGIAHKVEQVPTKNISKESSDMNWPIFE